MEAPREDVGCTNEFKFGSHLDWVGAEKKKVKRCTNLPALLLLMRRGLVVRRLLWLVEIWVVLKLFDWLLVELELLILLLLVPVVGQGCQRFCFLT